MSKFDKTALKALVKTIADYRGQPDFLCRPRHPTFPGPIDPDDPTTLDRLDYLRSHGMLDIGQLTKTNSGEWMLGMPINVTAKGHDWISEDGGITAEERKITISFDEDAFRQILINKVALSEAPEDEKMTLLHRIKTLPQEALRVAAPEVVKQAVDHAPDAFSWIEKALHLVQ